jgi:predicted Zn-dependent peptidase
MHARVVLIVVAASIAWGAASTPAPSTSAEETLPNGLRVVLIPHRANPMVASAVVVGAGVVQEPASASGASHFLEHLLFNGTTSRSQKQLYDDADRLGAYNNATTREDHTLFTLLVAKEHAEEGLALQADMLFRSTLPEENFDKERRIVLEELARDRTDPSYDVEAEFRAWAYADTPIARPVLGSETSLSGIARDQVVAYYRGRYVPSNMTLVVMGDLEIGPMREIVRKTFGAAPKGSRPGHPGASWPARKGDNVSIAPAPGGPSRLLAAFPVGVDPWDRTAEAIDALLEAAAEGEDAPLQRALERRGLTSTKGTMGLEPRQRPWSTVAADVELRGPCDPRQVLDAIAEAVQQTRAGGIARDRLSRVIAKRRAEEVVARDQIHYFVLLRSSTVLGAPAGRLTASRLEDLGEKDWDAASAALEAGLAQLRARFTAPEAAASKLTWGVPPAAAAAAKAALRAGTLANGLRYVVRAGDDSEVFALHLMTSPRAAGEPAGQDGISDLLHRVMLHGSIVRDEAALHDRLARIGARLKTVDDPSVPFDDYYTTTEFAWIRLEVPFEQWREGLGLVAEIVRFPAIDGAALDAGRREMEALIARNAGSPRSVALARLDELLAPGQAAARPVLGTTETIGSITVEALRAHHAATAVGRRTIVSVVGSIDADEVVRALEADLGSMPEGQAPPGATPAPLLDRRSAELRLEKSQAYVAMGEVIDVAAADRAAFAVAVAMLSERLAFDLRETRGLAYAVGAQARPWAGRTRVDLTIGTRLENVDEGRAGLLSGLEAFRSDTFSDADVERAVLKVRGAALMRRMTRMSLAFEAGMEVLRGQEPGDERRFLDALQTVRADDVRRVASERLDPDRLSVVVVR